jgi:hypothetical protein
LGKSRALILLLVKRLLRARPFVREGFSSSSRKRISEEKKLLEEIRSRKKGESPICKFCGNDYAWDLDECPFCGKS